VAGSAHSWKCALLEVHLAGSAHGWKCAWLAEIAHHWKCAWLEVRIADSAHHWLEYGGFAGLQQTRGCGTARLRVCGIREAAPMRNYGFAAT
jgi:hypothetical protein